MEKGKEEVGKDTPKQLDLEFKTNEELEAARQKIIEEDIDERGEQHRWKTH